METIIAALRRWFRTLTPAEAEMAELGAADAYRDVFEPPVRPDMRRAYESGWYDANGAW